MKDKKSYQLNPSIDRLTLRLVLPEEQERFNDLLKQHHYLHSAGSAGETLRYVAQIDGQWMGLLLWGAASYRLKDRDEWIGWDGAQRHARLKLVVQNRRFLILPGVDLANLASKTLGMCLRVLADHWQEAFGYRPLVAETFVDPQIHRGIDPIRKAFRAGGLRFSATGGPAYGWQVSGFRLPALPMSRY